LIGKTVFLQQLKLCRENAETDHKAMYRFITFSDITGYIFDPHRFDAQVLYSDRQVSIVFKCRSSS